MAVYGVSNRGYPILWYEGYWYAKNRETSASITWKCRRRAICSGCLNEKDGNYILTRPHENHEPEPPVLEDSVFTTDAEGLGTQVASPATTVATVVSSPSTSATPTAPTPTRPPSARRAALLAKAGPAGSKRKVKAEVETTPEPPELNSISALEESVPESGFIEETASGGSTPQKRAKMSATGVAVAEELSTPEKAKLAGLETVDLTSVVQIQDDQHIYFSEYEVATEVEIGNATFGANAAGANTSVKILTLNKSSTRPSGGKVTLASVEASLAHWLKPKLYGESWDNVGLLIGSGKNSKQEKVVNSIFLCNDLTTKVLKEAVSLRADLIVAYHPPIFSALKTLSYNSWKEEIVLKCVANDIAVYSPHTCLDAVPGGINDRIIRALKKLRNESESSLEAINPTFAAKATVGISFQSTIHNISTLFELICINDLHEVSVAFDVDKFIDGLDSATIMCYKADGVDDSCLIAVQELAKSIGSPDFQVTGVAPEAVMGSGRILRFVKPVKIGDVIETVREVTGVRNLKLVQGSKKEISSLALCVGSGASILKGLQVDVLITGEMTHHDLLDCIEANQSVILVGHADSERHYLETLAGIVRIVTRCENVIVSSTEESIFRYV